MKKSKKQKKYDVEYLDRAGGWFYSDIVKDHFFHPKNFLWNEKAKDFKYNAIGMVGSPACIKGDTLIHINFDLKEMQNLTKNDKVLSHDGAYNKITQFYTNEYRGTLIQIKNQLGNILASPDHLIYALQIPKTNTFFHNKYKKMIPASWIHVRDLNKTDITLYPIPKIINNIKYIKISIKKANYDFKSKNIPTKIRITKELLRLFGYFVAEGSTRKNNKEICFTFGISENNLAKDIKDILKKIFNLDVKINIRKNNNRIDILVYNVHLAKFLKELCGESCYNKHIPGFILFLRPELQKSFLYGLWRGDGYINLRTQKPRAEFSTSSKILVQQLKILLLRQKIQHSIYYEKAKLINGVNHKHCYRIHIGEYEALKKISKILNVKFHYPKVSRIATHSWFDKNYFYTPIRKVKKVNFNGKLFNLEVDKAHSYVTNAYTLHNCGDMMKMWLWIDPKTEKIKKCWWRTFGCASAIASTSMLSVMITEKGGMKIERALKLTPQDILNRLGGLPMRKIHCSVLGDKALQEAIYDYFRRTKQFDRIKQTGARIIDKVLKITDKDIEEAVKEGAKTLKEVQAITKVGHGDPNCLPEVEELIKFYREKYK